MGDHEPGFIMFAVGSAIRMNDMPQEMLDAFIQVFSRLPQRVIWQWKGNQRPHLPANVMAVNWLPQQDLLGNIPPPNASPSWKSFGESVSFWTGRGSLINRGVVKWGRWELRRWPLINGVVGK